MLLTYTICCRRHITVTYTICRRRTSTRVGLDVPAQQPHQNLLAAESQVSLAFSFSTLARSRTRPSVAAKKSLWAPQGAQNSLCECQLTAVFCYAKGKSADLGVALHVALCSCTPSLPYFGRAHPWPKRALIHWETGRKLTSSNVRVKYNPMLISGSLPNS